MNTSKMTSPGKIFYSIFSKDKEIMASLSVVLETYLYKLG